MDAATLSQLSKDDLLALLMAQEARHTAEMTMFRAQIVDLEILRGCAILIALRTQERLRQAIGGQRGAAARQPIRLLQRRHSFRHVFLAA